VSAHNKSDGYAGLFKKGSVLTGTASFCTKERVCKSRIEGGGTKVIGEEETRMIGEGETRTIGEGETRMIEEGETRMIREGEAKKICRGESGMKFEERGKEKNPRAEETGGKETGGMKADHLARHGTKEGAL
jgi:hypothetical protein